MVEEAVQVAAEGLFGDLPQSLQVRPMSAPGAQELASSGGKRSLAKLLEEKREERYAAAAQRACRPLPTAQPSPFARDHRNPPAEEAGAAEDEPAAKSLGGSGQAKQIRRWRKGNLLGRGAFGQVHQAMDLETGQLFAVKSIMYDARQAGEAANEHAVALEREISILQRLQSPHVVRYLGMQREQAPGSDIAAVHIFLEYMAGGSLASLLAAFGGAFGEELVQRYTREMLRGLHYLHSQGVCHGDIKGANVLMDADGRIALADFGAAVNVARLTDSLELTRTCSLKGTCYWMAPEVCQQARRQSEADVWSLGCTVIELLTGRPPWAHITNAFAVIYHIGSSSELPEPPAALSAAGRHFLARCLVRNPADRATAAELLLHPFVTGQPLEGALGPVRTALPPPLVQSGRKARHSDSEAGHGLASPPHRAALDPTHRPQDAFAAGPTAQQSPAPSPAPSPRRSPRGAVSPPRPSPRHPADRDQLRSPPLPSPRQLAGREQLRSPPLPSPRQLADREKASPAAEQLSPPVHPAGSGSGRKGHEAGGGPSPAGPGNERRSSGGSYRSDKQRSADGSRWTVVKRSVERVRTEASGGKHSLAEIWNMIMCDDSPPPPQEPPPRARPSTVGSPPQHPPEEPRPQDAAPVAPAALPGAPAIGRYSDSATPPLESPARGPGPSAVASPPALLPPQEIPVAAARQAEAAVVLGAASPPPAGPSPLGSGQSPAPSPPPSPRASSPGGREAADGAPIWLYDRARDSGHHRANRRLPRPLWAPSTPPPGGSPAPAPAQSSLPAGTWQGSSPAAAPGREGTRGAGVSPPKQAGGRGGVPPPRQASGRGSVSPPKQASGRESVSPPKQAGRREFPGSPVALLEHLSWKGELGDPLRPAPPQPSTKPAPGGKRPRALKKSKKGKSVKSRRQPPEALPQPQGRGTEAPPQEAADVGALVARRLDSLKGRLEQIALVNKWQAAVVATGPEQEDALLAEASALLLEPPEAPVAEEGAAAEIDWEGGNSVATLWSQVGAGQGQGLGGATWQSPGAEAEEGVEEVIIEEEEEQEEEDHVEEEGGVDEESAAETARTGSECGQRSRRESWASRVTSRRPSGCESLCEVGSAVASEHSAFVTQEVKGMCPTPRSYDGDPTDDEGSGTPRSPLELSPSEEGDCASPQGLAAALDDLPWALESFMEDLDLPAAAASPRLAHHHTRTAQTSPSPVAADGAASSSGWARGPRGGKPGQQALLEEAGWGKRRSFKSAAIGVIAAHRLGGPHIKTVLLQGAPSWPLRSGGSPTPSGPDDAHPEPLQGAPCVSLRASKDFDSDCPSPVAAGGSKSRLLTSLVTHTGVAPGRPSDVPSLDRSKSDYWSVLRASLEAAVGNERSARLPPLRDATPLVRRSARQARETVERSIRASREVRMMSSIGGLNVVQ